MRGLKSQQWKSYNSITMKRIFFFLILVLIATVSFGQDEIRTKKAIIRTRIPYTEFTGAGDTTIIWDLGDANAMWRLSIKYKDNADSLKLDVLSAILPEDSLDYANYAGLTQVKLVDAAGRCHFEDYMMTGTHLALKLTWTGNVTFCIKSSFKYIVYPE